MEGLLYKIDMWFSQWGWTDDIADVLWRGRCEHCIVALPMEVADMEPFLDYAAMLRAEGDWTVAVRQYEFVEDNEVHLIQFRRWSLFRWSDTIRTDIFSLSPSLEA